MRASTSAALSAVFGDSTTLGTLSARVWPAAGGACCAPHHRGEGDGDRERAAAGLQFPSPSGVIVTLRRPGYAHNQVRS